VRSMLLWRSRVTGGYILAMALWGEAETRPAVAVTTGLATSGTGLVYRALVDHLTIIHLQVTHVQGPSSRHRGHVEVLNTVEVSKGKCKAFPFLGTNHSIDVHGMNGLVACLIATTVAKWLPASGKTGEEYISHRPPPPLQNSCGTAETTLS